MALWIVIIHMDWVYVDHADYIFNFGVALENERGKIGSIHLVQFNSSSALANYSTFKQGKDLLYLIRAK